MRRVGGIILDHWDMWSSRNKLDSINDVYRILDHWDMWSSRNAATALLALIPILDHWDMWSSRNSKDNIDTDVLF